MKKTITLLFLCAVLIFSLAACASGGQSSTPASVPASTPAPQPASTPAQSAAPANTAALAEQLATAANLGGTFNVTETDLSLAGVTVENIVEFTGLESQLSSENGGIVVVISAQEGTANSIAEQMNAYRDSRMGNTDYAEFENARNNTSQARIEVFGNYVVYAVSATGHEGGWDALDAAIATAFA